MVPINAMHSLARDHGKVLLDIGYEAEQVEEHNYTTQQLGKYGDFLYSLNPSLGSEGNGAMPNIL